MHCFFCNLGHLSWARSLATRFLASLVGSTYSKSITGNTNSVSQRGILTFPPARPSRTMPSFKPDGLEVSLECLAGNPNEGRDTSWVEEAAGGSSFIVKCLSEIKELHDPFWSSHSQLTTASSSNLLLSLFRSVCVCVRALRSAALEFRPDQPRDKGECAMMASCSPTTTTAPSFNSWGGRKFMVEKKRRPTLRSAAAADPFIPSFVHHWWQLQQCQCINTLPSPTASKAFVHQLVLASSGFLPFFQNYYFRFTCILDFEY